MCGVTGAKEREPGEGCGGYLFLNIIHIIFAGWKQEHN